MENKLSCGRVGAMRYEAYYISEDRLKNRLIKEFDLRVGDIVQHREVCYSTGESGGKTKYISTAKFKVVGIYPHIFHCQVLDRVGGWGESFKKIDYQLGEVIKLRGVDDDGRSETE